MATTDPPGHSAAGHGAKPLVYGVVLTWNNLADTDECLRSLEKQDYGRFQTIVVDNGSTDGSLARLRQAWHGRVEFLSLGANLGVAAGYNAGIRAALAAGADFVVVFNNDVVAQPTLVGRLLRQFQDRPDTGIAASVMLYYDRPDLVWFARVVQHPSLGYTRNIYRGRPWKLVEGLPSAIESDFVPTCASMLSRKALEDVGLLDERFFFGHDDVDWCIRARRKGYACLVVTEALVRHKVSVTSGRRGVDLLSASAAYTHAKGSVLIGAKHFRGKSAAPYHAGLLLLRMPYNAGKLALSGHWRSTLKYLEGLAAGYREYIIGPKRPGPPLSER